MCIRDRCISSPACGDTQRCRGRTRPHTGRTARPVPGLRLSLIHIYPSRWRPHKKCKAFYPSFGGMLEPENIFSLLKLGLCVHKAGYGRSVSTALFPVPLSVSKVPQCNRYTIVRQFWPSCEAACPFRPAVQGGCPLLPARASDEPPARCSRRKRCPPARVQSL